MGEDGNNSGGSQKGGGGKNKNKPFWKNKKASSVASSKFQGACEELKHHVFDINSPSPSDQFEVH